MSESVYAAAIFSFVVPALVIEAPVIDNFKSCKKTLLLLSLLSYLLFHISHMFFNRLEKAIVIAAIDTLVFVAISAVVTVFVVLLPLVTF
jgi:hypothetical protein